MAGLFVASTPVTASPLDEFDDGPLYETVWFNGFGLTTPSSARMLSSYMAVGYEAVMNDMRSWGVDFRRDAYGGTFTGNNSNPVVFFGVGMSLGYYPFGKAPNGFYIIPHGSVGFGSFITYSQEAERNILHDVGGLELGVTTGYSWQVWKRMQVRAGLGTTMIYLPDMDHLILAGGLTGDLRIGYIF